MLEKCGEYPIVLQKTQGVKNVLPLNKLNKVESIATGGHCKACHVLIAN